MTKEVAAIAPYTFLQRIARKPRSFMAGMNGRKE